MSLNCVSTSLEFLITPNLYNFLKCNPQWNPFQAMINNNKKTKGKLAQSLITQNPCHTNDAHKSSMFVFNCTT